MVDIYLVYGNIDQYQPIWYGHILVSYTTNITSSEIWLMVVWYGSYHHGLVVIIIVWYGMVWCDMVW